MRAVGSVCSSEEAFLLVLLDGEVEDGPLVAVVDARDAGHVALPVVGLHLIDDFSGHVLQDHVAVVAEELLSIDEYLTDGLAVEREASVLVLHDAGQLLDEVLHHRPFGQLEGVGIVGYRIIDHRHLRQLAFHDGLRHHRRVFAHHDVGHLEVARLLGQRQLEFLHLVAHERHLQRVSGRRDAGQQELAVLLRRGAGYHRVALVVELHGSPFHGLQRLVLEDRAAYVEEVCGGGNSLSASLSQSGGRQQ